MGKLTIDEAIDSIQVGRFHAFCVILMGMVFAVTGYEMTLITLLDPLLRCAWQISSAKLAVLSTVFYVGAMIGNVVISPLADLYGRINILILLTSVKLYFGILCGLAPTYTWMLIFKTIIGVISSGTAVCVSAVVAEFSPSHYRGMFMLVLALISPLGSVIAVGFSYVITPEFGWRGLSIIGCIPTLVCVVFLFFMPESPRYFVAIGQMKEAEKALDRISQLNNNGPFTDQLLDTRTEPTPKQSISQLLSQLRPMYCTIVLLTFLSASQGFVYFGYLFLIVLLPQTPHQCLQNFNHLSDPIVRRGIADDISCCQKLHGSEYINILIAAAGEVTSNLLMLTMIDRIGRRFTLFVFQLISFPLVLLLGLCQPGWSLTLLIFTSRLLISGSLTLGTIYASEIAQTSVRATILGAMGVISSIGAQIGPALTQIMIPHGYGTQTVILYAILCFFGAIMAVSLPVETKDRQLYNTVADTQNPESFEDDRLSTLSHVLKYGSLDAKSSSKSYSVQ